MSWAAVLRAYADSVSGLCSRTLRGLIDACSGTDLSLPQYAKCMRATVTSIVLASGRPRGLASSYRVRLLACISVLLAANVAPKEAQCEACCATYGALTPSPCDLQGVFSLQVTSAVVLSCPVVNMWIILHFMMLLVFTKSFAGSVMPHGAAAICSSLKGSNESAL